MNTYPHALTRYGKMANAESNPLKQIVLLFDGAIKFLNMTADDIEAGDFVSKGEHSNRALDIISYLQGILNLEEGGAVADSYDKLYRSLTVLILRASVELDADLMRHSAELIVPVRDAWEINIQKAALEPALGNGREIETSAWTTSS